MLQTKPQMVVWAAYHLPILLIGIFVYEEVYFETHTHSDWHPIYNELLNYKWVQFEWLWNNTLDSIRTIKCWMTQGYRINNDECEFERDDPYNQDYFGEANKSNSKAVGVVSDWYINEIE